MVHTSRGQSMVEFALILPLLVLVLVGIFDIGRAFFAYIAITNAAREGARVFTFKPDATTFADINDAIEYEIGSNSVVDINMITTRSFQCIDPATNAMRNITTTWKACKSEAPILVTLTYQHDLILSFFFPTGLTLVRSAEMMVP